MSSDEEDDSVIVQLTVAVASMTDLMNRMMTANDEQWRITREQMKAVNHSAEVAHAFKDELKGLRARLEKIVHVLHEGNGEKPLITRVALLEERYSSLKEQVKEELEAESRHQEADSAGKWSYKVALVGAGAAIIVSLISAIIQKMM